MYELMKSDFNVEKVRLAGSVQRGNAKSVHNNRATHGLAMYAAGEVHYKINGKNLKIGKNSLIYMPKNSNYVVHVLSPEEDRLCYVINFDISEQIDFEPFAVKVKNTNVFIEWFKQAEQAWLTKYPGYMWKCKANLYNILFALKKELDLGYISQNISEIINSATEYIHENYADRSISIADLANLCGISETYFRRIFKKTMGISPLKYINMLKLSRAKELISSCLYSISEVSELSGFHDEAYFSREFKKATGVCPSEYAGNS